MSGDSIRAVRNNNPGNIEKNPEWQGLMPLEEMTDAQRNESRFAVFKSPTWGFRAMGRNLITYQDKRRAADGSVIDTVREIITRWAPPKRQLPDGTFVVENDTEAYIKRVCALTGFEDSDTLDMHLYAHVAPVVKAIATVECGGWFFDDAELEEGMRLAGVVKQKALAESSTIKATTVATAATGLGLVAEAVQQIAPATGVIREVASYAPQAAMAFVIILGCYVIYKLYSDWKRQQV